MRLYVFAISLFLHCMSCLAEPYSLQSYTRETDYTIGSVARQYLTIHVPLGYRLDEGSLPEKGVTEAVELRDITWKNNDNAKQTVYHFNIDWQIFVASETVKSIPLRGLELVFKRDKQSFTVAVPADAVLVSNLLPPKMDAKHVQPYPDMLPRPSNSSALVTTMLLAFAVLLLACLYIAWFFGWISFKAEKAMPFRQAWRAIRQLPNNASHEREAMQTISHAFNQYASTTITNENLASILQPPSKLAPYADEVRALYVDIQETFFAGKSPQHTVKSIEKLAKQLSKLELS